MAIFTPGAHQRALLSQQNWIRSLAALALLETEILAPGHGGLFSNDENPS